MADRYSGRHIRQSRHGAWVSKKRSRARSSRHLLPAAAALTAAGILIGGTGTVIQFSAPEAGGSVVTYDAAGYPTTDRDAAADRASRNEARPTVGPTVTTTTKAPKPKTSTTTKAAQPSGGGSVVATGSCEASFYDEPQETANGETFNPEAYTAAHKSLPFNTRVRVTNIASGKSVVVRINDRGPYIDGRCLDLSLAAFRTIASVGAGVANVRYEVLAQDAT